MRFNTRSEKNGVWMHMRKGSHQEVSAATQACPKLKAALRAVESGESLELFVAIAVEYASSCIGQLVLHEFDDGDVYSRLDPLDASTDVLAYMAADVRGRICHAVANDQECLAFWKEIQNYPLGLAEPNAVGFVRMTTRMIGCCIGQALAADRLTLLEVASRMAKFMATGRETIPA